MPKPPPSSSPFWKLFTGVTKFNTLIYRVSGGRLGNKLPGTQAPIILVHNKGRKSGKVRVAPLIGVEIDGRYVIVASKGGTDKHPAWYHNLVANPETEIEVGRRRIPVTARVVDDAEREELWPQMAAVYPPYDDYQEYAGGRKIPVLSLDPR